MNERVLIVGGSSPLGVAIATELSGSGYSVVTASRRSSPPLDITDPVAVHRVVEAASVDRIVHLSAPTIPVDPGDAQAHLRGLEALVGAAEKAGVRRIVFASSAAVYGDTRRAPLRETDPLDGHSAYARLKAESERILHASTRLPSTSLRIFNVYGPGFERSLINRLADGRSRPALRLSADFVRDYIHVDDVTSAVRLALASDAGEHVVMNVGTGIATSNVALADLVPAGAYSASAGGSPSWSVADMTTPHTRFGFRAQRSLSEHLRR